MDDEDEFNRRLDSIEEYLAIYVEHRDAPQAAKAALEPALAEAKQRAIASFKEPYP